MKYKGPARVAVFGARDDTRVPFLVSRGRVMLGQIEAARMGDPHVGVVAREWQAEDGSRVRVAWSPWVKQVWVAPSPIPVVDRRMQPTPIEHEFPEEEWEYFDTCYSGLAVDIHFDTPILHSAQGQDATMYVMRGGEYDREGERRRVYHPGTDELYVTDTPWGVSLLSGRDSWLCDVKMRGAGLFYLETGEDEGRWIRAVLSGMCTLDAEFPIGNALHEFDRLLHKSRVAQPVYRSNNASGSGLYLHVLVRYYEGFSDDVAEILPGGEARISLICGAASGVTDIDPPPVHNRVPSEHNRRMNLGQIASLVHTWQGVATLMFYTLHEGAQGNDNVPQLMGAIAGDAEVSTEFRWDLIRSDGPYYADSGLPALARQNAINLGLVGQVTGVVEVDLATGSVLRKQSFSPYLYTNEFRFSNSSAMFVLGKHYYSSSQPRQFDHLEGITYRVKSSGFTEGDLSTCSHTSTFIQQMETSTSSFDRYEETEPFPQTGGRLSMFRRPCWTVAPIVTSFEFVYLQEDTPFGHCEVSVSGALTQVINSDVHTMSGGHRTEVTTYEPSGGGGCVESGTTVEYENFVLDWTPSSDITLEYVVSVSAFGTDHTIDCGRDLHVTGMQCTHVKDFSVPNGDLTTTPSYTSTTSRFFEILSQSDVQGDCHIDAFSVPFDTVYEALLGPESSSSLNPVPSPGGGSPGLGAERTKAWQAMSPAMPFIRVSYTPGVVWVEIGETTVSSTAKEATPTSAGAYLYSVSQTEGKVPTFSILFAFTSDGAKHMLRPARSVHPAVAGAPVNLVYDPLSQNVEYEYEGSDHPAFYNFAGSGKALKKLPPGVIGPIRRRKP